MGSIDQIRDFNRFYTRALGLTGRRFLQSGRRLAEVRLIHEIGALAPITARRWQHWSRSSGLGPGPRLHDICVAFVRQAGYRRMVLWTHAGLSAACALCARNGWQLVRSVPGRAYGQDVVDQDWEITL